MNILDIALRPICVLLFSLWMLVLPAAAQQTSAGPPLVIGTTSLPKAFLRRPFESRLEAQGALAPYVWKVSGGALPPGLTLTEAGVLNGTPTEAGRFHFVITVVDSSRPAQERTVELSLDVLPSLLAEWKVPPHVNGERIEGIVKVSNNTEDDFDLTFILLAVSESGRATALGYQHFVLRKGTDSLEIPFGDNLPRGSYQIHADVVGEVAPKDTIYRARLVTRENLQVQTGP
jgi:hypothetical protein